MRKIIILIIPVLFLNFSFFSQDKILKDIIKKDDLLILKYKGVRIRKEPRQDSVVLKTFDWRERIKFSGEVSENIDEITIRNKKVKEYWYKVIYSYDIENNTVIHHYGWVFGGLVDKNPDIKILTTGRYLERNVESILNGIVEKNKWHGVYDKKDHYEIIETEPIIKKFKVKNFEETCIFITVKEPKDLIFLVNGLEIKNKNIPKSFKVADSSYEKFKLVTDNGDYTFFQVKEKLKYSDRGVYIYYDKITQRIQYDNASDESKMLLIWEGDIDGDKKSDFLMNLSSHYWASNVVLLLSSYSYAEDEVVIPVADIWSCGDCDCETGDIENINIEKEIKQYEKIEYPETPNEPEKNEMHEYLQKKKVSENNQKSIQNKKQYNLSSTETSYSKAPFYIIISIITILGLVIFIFLIIKFLIQRFK